MDNTEYEMVDSSAKKNMPIIKRRNFTAAQNQLKKLSKQTATHPKLDRVDTNGGLFGWFDHKVTGDELNTVTAEITSYLVSINEMHSTFITEFKEVYKALDALDKDYIQAILIAIGENKVNNERIRKAQKDIDKNIEAQKATIDKLKELSERIKKVEHFFDIDVLWAKSDEIRNSFEKFEAELKGYKHLADIDSIWKKTEDVQGIKNDVFKHTSRIASLEDYKKGLEKIPHLYEIGSIYEDIDKLKEYEHLSDIDAIWEKTEVVPSIKSAINAHAERLRIIEDYQNNLKALKHLYEVDLICDDVSKVTKYLGVLKGYEHLDNIDTIWEKAEKIPDIIDTIKVHTNQIKALEDYQSGLEGVSHLYEVDSIYDDVSKINTYLDIIKGYEHLPEIDSIWANTKKIQQCLQSTKKKIIVAYTVAGTSLALTIVGMVLQLLKVI